MSTTMSLIFTDDQIERLEREAQRLGKSPSAVAARWVEEKLRESEFPYIEFREAYRERDAFLRGTNLKIWLLINHVRANDGDIVKTAAELDVTDIAVANAVAICRPVTQMRLISRLQKTAQQLMSCMQ